MNLKEIYSQNILQEKQVFVKKTPIISFEVFPPKNDEDGSKLEKLLGHLKILKKFNPAFISLTYGAGGTTQNTSLNIIEKIKELELSVMPHFTCVGTSKAQVEQYLQEIQLLGIENILALRGDIPEGLEQQHFDFQYANELVEFIKSQTSLSIGVAGYPEGHISCDDYELDLKNLKRKVSAGADAIFTQMFFDNDILYRFMEKAQTAGINTPIIPGILPIMSYNQLERMLSMARVTMPNTLMDKLEKYKDNPEDIKKIGVDFASHQCQGLIESGIKGLHFYTLNTSTSVAPILENII